MFFRRGWYEDENRSILSVSRLQELEDIALGQIKKTSQEHPAQVPERNTDQPDRYQRTSANWSFWYVRFVFLLLLWLHLLLFAFGDSCSPLNAIIKKMETRERILMAPPCRLIFLFPSLLIRADMVPRIRSSPLWSGLRFLFPFYSQTTRGKKPGRREESPKETPLFIIDNYCGHSCWPLSITNK